MLAEIVDNLVSVVEEERKLLSKLSKNKKVYSILKEAMKQEKTASRLVAENFENSVKQLKTAVENERGTLFQTKIIR